VLFPHLVLDLVRFRVFCFHHFELIDAHFSSLSPSNLLLLINCVLFSHLTLAFCELQFPSISLITFYELWFLSIPLTTFFFTISRSGFSPLLLLIVILRKFSLCSCLLLVLLLLFRFVMNLHKSPLNNFGDMFSPLSLFVFYANYFFSCTPCFLMLFLFAYVFHVGYFG